MKHIAAMLLALSVVGCAAPGGPSASAPPPVKETRDEFRKVTEYRGADALPYLQDDVFIRAWRPDGQAVKYQIYVVDYYIGDWRFYSSANDINGKSHDVTMISRDVISCSRFGCSKTETMGLNVGRDYLEQHRQTGITFKLFGRAGEQVFTLPQDHIASFLDAVKP